MRSDSHTQLPKISTRYASFFVFIYLEMSLLPCIFVPLPFFSLYVEYVVRFSLPDGVFLPCDHGLDFFTSAYISTILFTMYYSVLCFVMIGGSAMVFNISVLQ